MNIEKTPRKPLRLLEGKCCLENSISLYLDEINNALQLKLIDFEQVVEILDKKPSDLHLILTGRDAHPEIIERADTVSEVREIKHAYTKGIEPQPGIDY